MKVREGSSKNVVTKPRHGVDAVDLVFTDRFSVFDVGRVPYEIEEMGYLRHAIAVRLFGVLEAANIKTHFISALEPRTITVEAFNNYSLNERHENARAKIVPLEIIDRQEVTEALLDRAKTNDELRSKIADRVHGPIELGARLTRPLIECTTKFEPIDRKLQDQEAIDLADLGRTSFDMMCETVSNASMVLTEFFAFRGFNRIDGKWEVGITYQGPTFVIADTYSPDEMRLIGPGGLSYDKDPLRLWYKNTFPEWITALDKAKEEFPVDKSKWPAYPPDVPPDGILDDLRNRYRMVAKAIGAL